MSQRATNGNGYAGGTGNTGGQPEVHGSAANVVLLTEVVETARVSPDVFRPLIRDGDPRDLLEALARDGAAEPSPRGGVLPTLWRLLFGVPRDTPIKRARRRMKEMANVCWDAAWLVESMNEVRDAHLKASLTDQRFELARQRLDANNSTVEMTAAVRRGELEAQLAQASLKQAKAHGAIEDLHDAAILKREQREARGAEHRLARAKAEETTKGITDGRTGRRRSPARTTPVIDGAAGGPHAEIAHLESCMRSFQDGIHRRDAELNAREREIAELRNQLRQREDEALAPERRRQEEKIEAEHQLKLAELATGRLKHEADARRFQEPERSPEEEAFERGLLEQRQRQQRLDRLEAQLEQVAAAHGTDSDLYRRRAVELDGLKLKILGGAV